MNVARESQFAVWLAMLIPSPRHRPDVNANTAQSQSQTPASTPADAEATGTGPFGWLLGRGRP
jgi:hypothetical protein